MNEPSKEDPTAERGAGPETIAALTGTLSGDAEWVVPDGAGFTWWSSRIRERVWSEPAGMADGDPQWHVRTWTPVFRDVEDDDAVYAWMNDRNVGPGMGAWIFDAEARTVSYRCGAIFGDVAMPWMPRWLLAATLLGAGIPHLATSEEEAPWAVDDVTHPERGPRTDPHPMLADLGALGDRGATRPPIPPASLRRLAADFGDLGVDASYDETRDLLFAPVPFGDDEVAGWGMTTIHHRLLGWGLFMRQTTPRRFGVRRARWIANALNLAETADRTREAPAPAFGAWQADEKGHLYHLLYLTASTVGSLEREAEVSLATLLLGWGARRSAALAVRLPWLESAAAARYPDDMPPDLSAEEAAQEESRIPIADRGFGPGARAPRPRRTSRRTDPAQTLLVDPADPAAHAEIDAAVAVADDGDTVRIRPGTYRTPVVVDRAVAIVGDGPVDAIILETMGGECLGFAASGGSVRGLTIRPALAGNDRLASSAISVRDVSATVDSCVLSTHLGATAWIGGPAARVSLRDCRFTDGSQNAVYVLEGARVEMTGCEIRDHRWPITVAGRGSSLRISRCTIAGNLSDGVSAGEGTRLDVRDSLIEGNAGDGVELIGIAPVSSVTGCTITGNGGAGVAVRGGTGGVVRDNRLAENAVGISVSDGATPRIEENELDAHARVGIGVSDVLTAPRVTGNTVRNGQAAGVVIRNGAGGVFERNEVEAGDASAIWVDGAGTRPTLRDNVVHGSRGCGIAVTDRAGGTFEGNDLRGNARGSWDLRKEGDLLERRDNREDEGTIGGTAPTPTPWSPPTGGSGPSRAN